MGRLHNKQRTCVDYANHLGYDLCLRAEWPAHCLWVGYFECFNFFQVQEDLKENSGHLTQLFPAASTTNVL